jgi:hypothetical protein
MKRLLATTAIIAGAMFFHAPAFAALISISNAAGNCGAPAPGGACEGLTYTLEAQATANPLTEQFALLITGQNSASDTVGGRTGIDAFAFNLVNNKTNSPATGVVVGALIDGALTINPSNWVFKNGGLNSTGCNSTGNFFCFDNTAIDQNSNPQIIPTTPLGTTQIVIGFEATLLPGDSWADYSTALKINWVGTANNYSLVSEDIPVNMTCPNCVINPTVVDASEPYSIALLGFGLLGTLAAVRRKAR